MTDHVDQLFGDKNSIEVNHLGKVTMMTRDEYKTLWDSGDIDLSGPGWSTYSA